MGNDVSLRFEPNDFIQARRGGFRINPDGQEAAELRKHEQHPTYYTGPQGPGNPYRYRPFPKMLYRAELTESGKIASMATAPHPLEFRMALDPSTAYRLACEAADGFTLKCQKIVNDDREYQMAREAGYCESPQEAEEYLRNRLRADGDAAAERAHTDRKMGEKARLEAAAAEAAAAPFHVASIPEQRRGRKPMSEEARKAAGERLKAARAAKAASKE